MDLLAIWLGKLTVTVLTRLGRRATALPGLVVEKVFPSFLRRRLARLPYGVVVVSGTNGKTTTTKMVAAILTERYRVLTNDTGGNFVRGTITALLMHSDWRGRTPADVAVFELDEAHAVLFCAQYPPQRLLLLNVLRDQLDRFGEIDATAALLAKSAAATTGHLILNRDDSRLAGLHSAAGAAVSHFGVAGPLRSLFPTDEELYDEPGGQATVPAGIPVPAEFLVSAELQNYYAAAVGSTVTLRIGTEIQSFVLQAEGAHNAQNAAAAAAVGLTFDLTVAEISAGLRSVEPAFGRGQSFAIGGRRVVLQLVKNPAGFRLSLRTVAALAPAAIVLCINDDYADGRDVSWLWDVDFAALAAEPGQTRTLVTSGTRADDMALRLHYDEYAVELVEPDLAGAVRQAGLLAAAAGPIAVFATYTAMWELHRVLTRRAAGEVVSL